MKTFNRRALIKLGGLASGAALAHASNTAGAERLPSIPRRVLGKTQKKVPILMMGGSWQVDVRFDVRYAEALRLGIDYFDTSIVYAGGNGERALGNTLAKLKARSKAWITTKSKSHTPEGAEASLQKSLQSLRTDHVEGFFLHGLKDPGVLNKAMARTVEQLKKKGKIHHFGFSTHANNVAELLKAAAGIPWVEFVMFRYNFRDYGKKALNEAIDAAAKANLGLIAMKTQGSEVSFRDAWKKFEKTGKWNKHQAVLKAVWEDQRLAGAVSEMDNLDKLAQNFAAAVDRTKLGALERDAVEKYAQDTRNLACDGCDHLCGERLDAPVQIGDTMRCLMYHDVYGQPEAAQAAFDALPPQARSLKEVDFSEARCPHGVDIQGMMQRAAQVFSPKRPV